MLITEKLKRKEIMSKTEGELAEATYTSPATIVRMCKKLGICKSRRTAYNIMNNYSMNGE